MNRACKMVGLVECDASHTSSRPCGCTDTVVEADQTRRDGDARRAQTGQTELSRIAVVWEEARKRQLDAGGRGCIFAYDC